MPASDYRILCQLLWKLSRKHTWARSIPKDDLVRLALDRVDRSRGRELVDKLLAEPYLEFDSSMGYRVKNDPDSQALVAARLTRTCWYSELQVEPTLSRFEQAGGFDSYDMDVLLSVLHEEWPESD